MGVGNVAVAKIHGSKKINNMLKDIDLGLSGAADEAVMAGAEVLADEVRWRLKLNLLGSKHSTGDLEASFGIAPVRYNFKKGTTDTKVGFAGYDRNGVPNLLKARAMESGTSRGQPKRPFFRPAVKTARKHILKAMQETLGRRLRQLKGGN